MNDLTYPLPLSSSFKCGWPHSHYTTTFGPCLLADPLGFPPLACFSLYPPSHYQCHVYSKLLTMEQEGFPIYYGQTPVTTHAAAANSVLAIFPPSSPFPCTLHKFQSLTSRPPNCYIQFKLRSCGSVHGFLTSLIELDATAPLYGGRVGDLGVTKV